MPNLKDLFARESRWIFGLLLALVLVHTVWEMGMVTRKWMPVVAFGGLALGLALLVNRRLSRLQRTMTGELDSLVETAERLERREPSGGHSAHGIHQVDRTERALLKIAGLLQEHDQLKAQLQVMQRQQVLGVLACELTHDLTNRLTVVLGQLDLAMDGMPDGDPRKRHLRHAENAAQGCVQCAQAVLAFDAGGRTAPVPVDLNRLVDKVCGLLRRVLDDKIRVVLELGQDLPAVQGHEAQLEQVVMNLGLNARQAMQDGGTLAFRTTRSVEGWAALTVEDTGVGISPELLDRIWQPFFSTRHPEDGVGLGLATSREILRDHGGRIQVVSTPGKGSAFTLLLPPSAVSVTAAVEPTATSPRPSFDGLRILVAEDEPEIRMVMKELLSRMGAEVVAGVDGEDAWNLWELLGPFDLLITDQRMPRLNGLELLGRIRARSREFPVLVMTGYGLEEASAVLAGDGRARLLAKPFTVPALVEALRALVDSVRKESRLPG